MIKKNILPNAWKSCLREQDWNFSLCQTEEWDRCLQWELHREKIQRDNEGSFPGGIQYQPVSEERRLARFSHGDEEIRETLKRLGRIPKGSLAKIAWPSYLEIRQGQLWKQIKKSDPDFWTFLSLDWQDLHRNWGEEVKYAATHIPASPILDGDGTTQLFPIKIPWHWSDDEIAAAFRQWLRVNRPANEPPPKPKIKVGRGSKIIQAKANLKALAAWRLIQHYEGQHDKAYRHHGAKEYLKKQFQHESAWPEARQTIEALLRKFHFYPF